MWVSKRRWNGLIDSTAEILKDMVDHAHEHYEMINSQLDQIAESLGMAFDDDGQLIKAKNATKKGQK